MAPIWSVELTPVSYIFFAHFLTHKTIYDLYPIVLLLFILFSMPFVTVLGCSLEIEFTRKFYTKFESLNDYIK